MHVCETPPTHNSSKKVRIWQKMSLFQLFWGNMTRCQSNHTFHGHLENCSWTGFWVCSCNAVGVHLQYCRYGYSLKSVCTCSVSLLWCALALHWFARALLEVCTSSSGPCTCITVMLSQQVHQKKCSRCIL